MEGGEALAPPSNARRELGILKRQCPFPTIPCAVVGLPDFHITTIILHDDPSSQELGLDSPLSPLHLAYRFPIQGKPYRIM
jgi:hypothetical protein